MRKMFLLALIAIIIACDNEIPESNIQEKNLTELNNDLCKLKENLSQTAKVLISLTNDECVDTELKSLGATYDIADSLFSLKEILFEPSLKNSKFQFSNLKKAFLEQKKLKSSVQIEDLLTSINLHNYVMWMPYPLEWYSEDKQFLTIVSHPLDNLEENIGYRLNDGVIEEVLVNEEYNDEFPVLIIAPNDIINEVHVEENLSLLKSTNNNVLQVRIGEFISKSKFGTNYFDKNVSFEILRGQGELSNSGKTATSSWPTSIGFKVSKKHIKSASKGWTKYKNGGWVSVNVLWDYNWTIQKTEQALVLVCTSATSSKQSISTSVSVNEKGDLKTAVNVDTEIEVTGKVVGYMTIDRDGFLKMSKNHYDMKNGWAVHSVHADVKFTMPYVLR